MSNQPEQPMDIHSFRNLRTANETFGYIGMTESLLEALAAKGIFTIDEAGNIIEVDGFKVERDVCGHSSLSLVTPRRRDLTTSGGSVRLQEYLTPEEIAACINEEKHRRAERLRISRQIA
mgnify:CR=1 FL=1